MMDATLFRKKYLGEVTLKNGEHVKFLFPLTDSNLAQVKIAAQNAWKQLQNRKSNIREYEWVFIDNLNLQQFQTVYAGIKIYGKNYWKLVWEHYLQQNKKSI